MALVRLVLPFDMGNSGDEIAPSLVPQPWSDAARGALVEINRQERHRRQKVARFQDRLADIVVDDDMDAQPVAFILAAVTKFAITTAISSLTYVTVWLTRGSGWTTAEVATGVLAAVILGVVGGGAWFRLQHPEREHHDADVHAPEEWSLRKRQR